MDVDHDQIAHIIPTHERPQMAQRLVDSINEQFPGARVYVCDDSASPSEYEGCENVASPAYDIGLSAKRNVLVEATDEPYVFVWDDDYIAYESTRLEPFWHVLREVEDIGIVGGEWLLNDSRTVWFTGNVDYKGPKKFHEPPQEIKTVETEAGQIRYNPCDFVPNWFLADRRTLEVCPWDQQLKLQEHIEHFARLLAIRAEHYPSERGRRWRERYLARSKGKTVHREPEGGMMYVYTLASFSNDKYLSNRPGNHVSRDEWIKVPTEYGEELLDLGLAQDGNDMEGTRPFPLPSVPPPGDENSIPLRVALIPDTTCIHDRDHRTSEQYMEQRRRQRFWDLQHQKMGCTNTDMRQWTEYPWVEFDYTEPTESDFAYNR